MTSRLSSPVVLIAVVAVIGAASARAQQPTQSPAHDPVHHQEMLARGAQAMGFDQERTVHHFLLYADGGAIDVAVKEASDHVNLHAIRQHLPEVALAFKAGDFTKPFLTHAQQVPGTVEMARLKDRITYQYEETTAGGRVRIVTRDAAALAAVHAFLRFQIEDHRTGDPGRVEAMSLMGEIHDLFMSHDRMTRTVANLPNGIRTVTESTDPRVAQLLIAHVVSMNARVEKGDDPGLPIESPALRAIFKNHESIRTTLETTATGIVVMQTSTDPATVALLQQHASEVSSFVDEGMAAMHKAMMRNGR
ncbi:MAG: hypothetical protein ABL986_15465 [Vicinamibacterales bacterium]